MPEKPTPQKHSLAEFKKIQQQREKGLLRKKELPWKGQPKDPRREEKIRGGHHNLLREALDELKDGDDDDALLLSPECAECQGRVSCYECQADR